MAKKPKAEAVMPLNIRIAEMERSGENHDELAALRRRRAEIMTRRATERDRARVPLFADQVPERQPEAQLDAEEKNRQAWAEMLQRHAESARARRAEIATAVTAEQLAALDERWRTFKGPHEPTYEATFWLERYREIFGRNPLDVPIRPGESWPPPGYEGTWSLDARALDAQKQAKRKLK